MDKKWTPIIEYWPIICTDTIHNAALFTDTPTTQVIFTIGCGPRCQTIPSDLTNSRISTGKWHLEFFHIFKFNTNLSSNIWTLKKFCHIISTESSNLLLGFWPMTQYFFCFLMHT